MKKIAVALAVSMVAFVFVAARMAQIKKATITYDAPRTAVALEFVIERDANDNITKIHRFILWSNGEVTFPNLPYYASLRLNCRDCPQTINPCPEDLDGNGVVAIADLLLLNAAMGKRCTE